MCRAKRAERWSALWKAGMREMRRMYRNERRIRTEALTRLAAAEDGTDAARVWAARWKDCAKLQRYRVTNLVTVREGQDVEVQRVHAERNVARAELAALRAAVVKIHLGARHKPGVVVVNGVDFTALVALAQKGGE